MINIDELVGKLELERSRTFVSFSSKNKKIATLLIKKLSELKLRCWGMYDKDGKDSNIGGEDYKAKISDMIRHTCLFIILISKESVSSIEVMDEIKQIRNEIDNDCTKPTINIYPIIVDDMKNKEIPSAFKEELKINQRIIVRTLNENTSKEELDVILDEIKERYVNAIVDNTKQKISLIRNSNKFSDLLNLCIKQDCNTNFVSEDIKDTPEIEHSSENEVHVLTNEMKNYDYNTYSLMVISSNLLGDPIRQDNEYIFTPSKSGSKYFYYITSDYKPEADTVFSEIKAFIKKNRESRLKVTNLIRKDFCIRNKLLGFFEMRFSEKQISELLDLYGIDKSISEEERTPIIEMLSGETAMNYFMIKNVEGRISKVFYLPPDFITWLKGDNPIASYENRNIIVKNFVNFIGKFIDELDKFQEPVINTQLLSKLKYHYQNLIYLIQLEDWQNGKYMKPVESRQIVHYLLNETDSNVGHLKKDYLHLESWMNFSYDENLNVKEIPDEVVEEAFKNCHLIIVDDFTNDKRILKLCYSFALFINHDGLTSSWYTTGNKSSLFKDVEGGELVTTYNMYDRKDKGYDELLDAFYYMLEVNPIAKQELIDSNSKILNFLKPMKGE